jgi:hypothetical protein
MDNQFKLRKKFKRFGSMRNVSLYFRGYCKFEVQYKSRGSDQIPADMIEAKDESL